MREREVVDDYIEYVLSNEIFIHEKKQRGEREKDGDEEKAKEKEKMKVIIEREKNIEEKKERETEGEKEKEEEREREEEKASEEQGNKSNESRTDTSQSHFPIIGFIDAAKSILTSTPALSVAGMMLLRGAMIMTFGCSC